jgi:hypothetical protein
MSAPLRNLRLLGKTTNSLSASSGGPGEIFWDSTLNALRLFNGQIQGGRVLADRDWVLNNSSNFSGSYADLTNKPNIPTLPSLATVATSGSYADLTNKPTIPAEVSLTGYATESYVTTAISGISIPSLTGYATETYVGDAIGAIPPPSLSNIEGLSFQRGVAVAEFSSDDSMTDDASDTVPVESAVRGYIDRRLGLDHDGAAVAALSLIGPGYAALNGATFSGNVVANTNVSSGLAIMGGAEYGLVQERVLPLFIQSTTPTHNLGAGALGWNNQFYCTLQTANFTPNIRNVPTDSYSVTASGIPNMITFTYVMVQGASTKGIPTALQINDVTQTIRWAGNVVPTSTFNKIDVVTFKCYVVDGVTASNGLFTVLGSMTSFG